MLTKTEKLFSILFFFILLAELICSNINSLSQLHYFTKPAVVISLLIYFWKQSKQLSKKIRLLTVLALLFSLIGDILLLFVNKSSNYFVFGLIAFLLAHSLYVLVFLKHKNPSKKMYGFIVFMLIYACGLFYFLKDGLGDMLLPVIVYMLVILTMATSSFIRKVNKLSYNLVFIGALFFMLSDSILALNKFYEPLAFSNITIMLTYAIAQYLIVIGILKISKCLH